LANEIDEAAYVDPASVHDRREWARNIVLNYRYARWFAKVTLFFMNIGLAAAIVLPWIWVLDQLQYTWWSVILVLSLILPAALDVFLEMLSLIWPSKRSPLLLGWSRSRGDKLSPWGVRREMLCSAQARVSYHDFSA